MTIFGIRIMRERTFRAYEAHCVEEIEILQAKYQYAKARAIIAERPRFITVKPVAMGVDSGVRIEVDTR